MKMKEDETIGKYFLRVEELVNAMKELGEKIEEPSLVQKILRSLPKCYTYHNFGHKVVDCCLRNYEPYFNPSVENVKVWKMK
jgi:hypothetical protein